MGSCQYQGTEVLRNSEAMDLVCFALN